MAKLTKMQPQELAEAAPAANSGNKAAKFVSYPVCFIFGLFMFGFTFYGLIPAINRYALISFGSTIETLLAFYPSFIILDFIVAGLAVVVTYKAIDWFVDFCKRHIGRKERH